MEQAPRVGGACNFQRRIGPAIEERGPTVDRPDGPDGTGNVQSLLTLEMFIKTDGNGQPACPPGGPQRQRLSLQNLVALSTFEVVGILRRLTPHRAREMHGKQTP